MTVEGPTNFGLENPFCKDCSGCDSRVSPAAMRKSPKRVSHPVNDTANCLPTGYHAMEYARDVEMQSAYGSTTQENLAWFLNKESVKDTLCIINSGLHDMRLPNITDAQYLDNVVWMHQTLLKNASCSGIVWLEITVPKTERYPQKAERTHRWNNMLRENLTQSFPSDLSIVEVGKVSQEAAHADNVHMSSNWYANLAKFFKFILGLRGRTAMDVSCQI